MGGIDDLIDDAEEEEVTELATELGLEDKQDIEELDNRLSDIYTLLIAFDKQLEKIENRLKMLEKTVLADDQENQEDEEDEQDENSESTSGLEF